MRSWKECACFSGHGGEKKMTIITRERLLLSTRELEMLFPPLKQSSTLFVFYLREAKRGFIFQRLYHSKVAAKPAKLFPPCCHPEPPSPPLSAVWHVKTSCLGGGGGGEDRCKEEMCAHIRPSLSRSCLLGGSAEGRLRNRTIHHAGLTHLSHA